MIYDETNFPKLPHSWSSVSVNEACENVSVREKVQQKAYQATGPLAVVDQGSSLIGGYTSSTVSTVTDQLPVIVFGDHTRIIKFIDFPFAAGADGIKVLRPLPFYSPRTFYRFLQSIRLPDKGYARHFQHLRSSQIPLPPLGEQARIATKLDAVIARIDACREKLERLPAILKRFREAVLEAAVSGRLTEEWRGEHGSPEWQKVNLSSVCRSITDGDHQAPPRADKGVPFITISAINDGRLRLEKATRYVPESYYKSLKPERKPSVGDILFSVTGSIAIPALVDSPDRFTFQRHIAILKPDTSLVVSRYLLYSLGTRSISDQAQAVATGIAQLTIPLSGLRALSISLPPVVEQTEIARRVDELFALADSLERKYRTAVGRVEKLTPAVLAKAFRGGLVEQDPEDEPAERLLERIRVERKNMPAKKKRGRVIKKTLTDTIQVVDSVSVAADAKQGALSTILRMRGRLTPEALLQASGLDIDAFYDHLKAELDDGGIREVRKGRGDVERYLEVAR